MIMHNRDILMLAGLAAGAYALTHFLGSSSAAPAISGTAGLACGNGLGDLYRSPNYYGGTFAEARDTGAPFYGPTGWFADALGNAKAAPGYGAADIRDFVSPVRLARAYRRQQRQRGET